MTILGEPHEFYLFLWIDFFDHFSRYRFNLAFLSLAEFKECFSLYDKKQKGKINTKDLITVMRCLGTSPTTGEIERHLQVHKIGAAPVHVNTEKAEHPKQNIPTSCFVAFKHIYVL